MDTCRKMLWFSLKVTADHEWQFFQVTCMRVANALKEDTSLNSMIVLNT